MNTIVYCVFGHYSDKSSDHKSLIKIFNCKDKADAFASFNNNQREKDKYDTYRFFVKSENIE